MLGYATKLMKLSKGWCGVICRSLDDVENILAQRWLNGDSSFMIRKWRVSFNPETEYFTY